MDVIDINLFFDSLFKSESDSIQMNLQKYLPNGKSAILLMQGLNQLIKQQFRCSEERSKGSHKNFEM